MGEGGYCILLLHVRCPKFCLSSLASSMGSLSFFYQSKFTAGWGFPGKGNREGTECFRACTSSGERDKDIIVL